MAACKISCYLLGQLSPIQHLAPDDTELLFWHVRMAAAQTLPGECVSRARKHGCQGEALGWGKPSQPLDLDALYIGRCIT